MNLHGILAEKERWSPIQVLLWIATRNRRFMKALKGLPISSLEECLWRLRSENHAPNAMTLANALQEFRREVECGSLRTLNCELPPKNGCAPATFNIPEFALRTDSWRAADVLRAWPAWPPAPAWNAATASSWQPRSGIPKGWIKTLPADRYLPLAEVVKILAFGPEKMAIGLSLVEEQVERLRAGIAIVAAAGKGKIKFVGMLCERCKGQPHLLRQRGPRILIESETLRELAPVPFGGEGWLGPRHFADGYAETGHAPESVSFFDVMVERHSLVMPYPALEFVPVTSLRPYGRNGTFQRTEFDRR
jgi:hypothetical protein